MLVQFSRHLILICIHCICLFMLIQCIHDLIQGIGRKKVIMVQKPHKLSLRHGKCRICILCNSLILIQIHPTDAAVFTAVLFQSLSHGFLFRASVGNAQLPVLIGLGYKRIYHLLQKQLRSPIRRNYHADKGRINKLFLSLFVKDRLVRRIRLIPGTIWNLLRLKPLMEPDPEFLQAIMPQI